MKARRDTETYDSRCISTSARTPMTSKSSPVICTSRVNVEAAANVVWLEEVEEELEPLDACALPRRLAAEGGALAGETAAAVEPDARKPAPRWLAACAVGGGVRSGIMDVENPATRTFLPRHGPRPKS